MRVVEAADGSGEMDLAGQLECTNMSWTSIAKLQDCAARHLGIPPEDWPFYDDAELVEDIPLEDAHQKCMKLRAVLAPYAEEDLPNDYWLRFLARMLREGWDFCAKAW